MSATAKAAEATATATPATWVVGGTAARPCECAMLGTGCTRTTTRTFAPGHDAKAKSRLLAAHRAGRDVTVTLADGTTFTASAREVARRWGFAHMITDAKVTEGATAE